MIEKTGTPMQPTPAVDATTTAEDEKLLEVAGQFEALMLSSMMKSMRATLSGDSLTGSTQQDMYQEMMDKEMVESIVSGEGLGLKQLLAQQLSKATEIGDAYQGQSSTARQTSTHDFTSSVELMSRLRVTVGEDPTDVNNTTNNSW